MLRMSKLTDYGFVLLTEFARRYDDAQPVSARDLADATNVPLPTVSKLLKTLSAHELLVSQRGRDGGYRLAESPTNITVERILTALEGPVAITECSLDTPACSLQSACSTRPHWVKINDAVRGALSHLNLAEMAGPKETLVRLRGAPAMTGAV